MAAVTGNTSDKLNFLRSIAFQEPNMLYVSDTYNQRIVKFILNTIEGSLVAGLVNSTAESTFDTLNYPVAIVSDDNRIIYVVDQYSH